MGITVKFDRNATVMRLENASKSAIFLTATQALKDSNYYCKMQSGDLINSSIRSSDLANGLLIWDTVYAQMQYYLDSTWKNTNPNAQKMWAHKAYSVNKDKWQEIMQAEFKRSASK